VNALKRILLNVFPPPRQPLRRDDALPLIVFLVVFAGVCLFLEFRHVLLFARPAAFLFTAATVWIWWMHVAGFGGLGRVRSLLALEVRLALAGLFVILLAEPRAVRTSDELSVVYAVDVSDSISDNSTTRALEFVARTATKKPPKDEAGLVIFGKNAAVADQKGLGDVDELIAGLRPILVRLNSQADKVKKKEVHA
jgi:hypothetical protein